MSLNFLVRNGIHRIARSTNLSKLYQKQLLHNRPKHHLSCLSLQKYFSSHDQENVLESPFPDIVVPDMQLPNFLWDHNCETRGDRIALVCLVFLLRSLYISLSFTLLNNLRL